jgi:hypothetical protein
LFSRGCHVTVIVTVVRPEDWKPYAAELRDIFGFVRESDPDPSEWFPADEFLRFIPYLENVRRARKAGLRGEEALSRAMMTSDPLAVDRATADHERASSDREGDLAKQRQMDTAGLGEIRLRAEDRLGIRRQGLGLPPDLRLS